MWTTLDGHRLRLSPDTAPAIVSEPDRWEIREPLRQNYRGDVREALNRTFAGLVSNAHRHGAFCGPTTGRTYRVFETRLLGRTFHILTSPARNGIASILAVRQGPLADLQEFMAQYGGKAEVVWSGPFSADRWQAPAHRYGGTYIVEKIGGGPLYVGESGHIGNEVAGYLNTLRKFEPLQNYRVRVGRVAGPKRKREMVEHVLIRQINSELGRQTPARLRQMLLRNASSFQPFVASRAITIEHKGKIPKFLNYMPVGTAGISRLDQARRGIRIAQGTTAEYEP